MVIGRPSWNPLGTPIAILLSSALCEGDTTTEAILSVFMGEVICHEGLKQNTVLTRKPGGVIFSSLGFRIQGGPPSITFLSLLLTQCDKDLLKSRRIAHHFARLISPSIIENHVADLWMMIYIHIEVTIDGTPMVWIARKAHVHVLMLCHYHPAHSSRPGGQPGCLNKLWNTEVKTLLQFNCLRQKTSITKLMLLTCQVCTVEHCKTMRGNAFHSW